VGFPGSHPERNQVFTLTRVISKAAPGDLRAKETHAGEEPTGKETLPLRKEQQVHHVPDKHNNCSCNEQDRTHPLAL
jgi:hypothetical protein